MSWLRAMGIAAGLVGGGVVGEALAERRDRQRFPPPGRFVEVGERRLHVVTRGTGDSVVLFDASLGAWSSHWSLLQSELAKTTQVVSYDRAGLGWSDPGPAPTLAGMVADLEIVLETVIGDRPVVACGHGLGALVVHRLARKTPDRVAALVVVDGFPKEFATSMVLPVPESASDFAHATGLARAVGWLRAGSEDDDSADVIAALAMQRRVRRAAAAERETRITHQDRDALCEPLGIPLRVIHSSKPFGRRSPNDYSLRWYAANEALLGLADESMQYVIRDCDHWIPQKRPDAVIEPIRALLAQLARAPRS